MNLQLGINGSEKTAFIHSLRLLFEELIGNGLDKKRSGFKGNIFKVGGKATKR